VSIEGTGSGTSYIGNTSFIGTNIKGQGGCSLHGIHVDGTVRKGGQFPQVCPGEN
jgi:hypothetical protein